MENSLVDDALDECSQIRIILVGSSKGKAQLIREIFGVNRITRYPPDFSRDEEIYSKENEYFVVHVFENWDGVADVIRRRKRGELDEVIHCIWQYVDAQEADDLIHNEDSEQTCPSEVRRLNVPMITIFGRFDNIVTRAAEIGFKRREGQPLQENDTRDAIQIRRLMECINLYYLQFPESTAVTSKSPSSKIPFLDKLLAIIRDEQVKMLLVVAQRLNPSWKFETSLRLAMKQFLLGTISTANPLPIPFAGLLGSSAATYMIKQDIIRVWNIYDPDYLCAGAQGQTSMMDTLVGIPQIGAKRLVYMIPVIAQINGIWETPRMARALGGLMIDLTLLMERAFLATMGVDAEALSRTAVHLARVAELHLHQKAFPSKYKDEQMPSRPAIPAKNGVPRMEALRDMPDDRPIVPPRHRVFEDHSKPLLAHLPDPDTDDKRSRKVKPPLPAKPSSRAKTRDVCQNGVPALEIASPVTKLKIDINIRPASTPISREMLKTIINQYEPIKAAVKDELEDFFDLENAGLKRSFQQDTVRRKLDSIVRKWRITEVVDLV